MTHPIFHPSKSLLAGVFLALSLAGLMRPTAGWAQMGAAPSAPAVTNPLLMPWAGPYGGVPPFDKVKVEQFKPALEAGMAESLREIEAIASNAQAPTFENTIAALERAGQRLDEVRTVYGIWAGTLSSPEVQAIERELAPRLAAFADQINQNERLFRRIEAVYTAPAKKQLTPNSSA